MYDQSCCPSRSGNSLTTDSCINAIRHFVSRRGPVHYIRSDNGTNLVGAEREMREAINNWNHNKIGSTLHQDGINWEFNPPTDSPGEALVLFTGGGPLVL